MLNSVECYHTNLDTWTPVTEMLKHRCGFGEGVLDGVLYAVSGYNGSETPKSVEAYRPSTGLWTTLETCNCIDKVQGLLCAVGGRDNFFIYYSVEVNNSITNTWTMLGTSMNVARCYAGVVAIYRPPHF